jgi:hypothetical protein
LCAADFIIHKLTAQDEFRQTIRSCYNHSRQKKREFFFMSESIKKFRDQSQLEFDQGGFDEWCIYLQSPDGRRYAPKDTEYFSAFQKLSSVHGNQKIYADFVQIYFHVGKQIDQKVLKLIEELSATYGEDAAEIEILFTIVYAGMVAEENKKFKVVGKRLKRLGMHQILFEKLAPEEAANFSKGKKVPELRKEFRKRGFA